MPRLRDLTKTLWSRRRRRYHSTFVENPDGQWVLADLRKYANPDVSVIEPGDPLLTGAREGARLMYLRITRILKMSDEDIDRLAQKESKHGVNTDQDTAA